MNAFEELKSLKSIEDKSIATVVRALAKIYKEESFRDVGFSSLFSFMTKGLCYSEGAAMRRIQAARLMAKDETLYEKLKSGTVSLCALSEVAKVKDETKVVEVLNLVEGKSKRESEKVVANFLPPVAAVKREVIKPVKVAATIRLGQRPRSRQAMLTRVECPELVEGLFRRSKAIHESF